MASEIRVDKINSLSGVGTVTLSPTGIDIAGITTTATLRATTGIVTTLTATTGIVTTLTTNTLTANSTAKVGSGVTLSPDGDIFATGVTTSTTFVGALTGNVTGTASGNAVLTGSTNNQVVTVTGSNAITGESGLTYDGNNFNVSAGAHDSGMAITAANNNQETQLTIKGKASDGTVHTFRLNAKRSANRLDIEGGGSPRISVDANGYVGINQSAPASELQVGGGTNAVTNKSTVHVAPSSGNASLTLRGGSPTIYFDGTSGGNAKFLTDGTDLTISNGNPDSAGTERFRFRTDGGLCFNGDTAAANALDDYEEGTWTPVWSAGGGSSGLANIANCEYVKIGELVHVRGEFSLTGGSGNISTTDGWYITGLPFPNTDASGTSGSWWASNAWTSGTRATGICMSYGTNIIYFGTEYASNITRVNNIRHFAVTYRTN